MSGSKYAGAESVMILTSGINATIGPAALLVAGGWFVDDSPAARLSTPGQQAVWRSWGVIFILHGRRSICLTRISL
jgi:hypothetical protein